MTASGISTVGVGPAPPDIVERWPAARPFLAVGLGCVVAGGVVAAVSRPTEFQLGPWVAAYLVLVGGVAQGALGAGQAWLSSSAPSRRLVRVQLVAWGVGVSATVAGQLLHVPAITSVGGLVTGCALLVFLNSVGASARPPRWAFVMYRACILTVLVSTPIGLALAWMRHR